MEVDAIQNVPENAEKWRHLSEVHSVEQTENGDVLIGGFRAAGQMRVPPGSWFVLFSKSLCGVIPADHFRQNYRKRELDRPSTGRKMMPGVNVVVLRGYQKDRYGVVLEEQESSRYVRHVLLDGQEEGEEFLISDLGLWSGE